MSPLFEDHFTCLYLPVFVFQSAVLAKGYG